MTPLMLIAAGAAPTVPLAVLDAALGHEADRRVEILEAPRAPRGCSVTRAHFPGKPSSTGRVVVELSGEDASHEKCEGKAFAQVRVFARALATVRAVRAGESLEGKVALVDRELRAGETPVTELPAGATAAMSLPANSVVQPRHLRVGPPPGMTIPVELRRGVLTVRSEGRTVACGPDLTCARLPTGKRVTGQLEGGVLLVDLP